MKEGENRMNRVDLYADGDMGLWVLANVAADEIGTLVTTDRNLETHARRRNLEVIVGSPKSVKFASQHTALSVHYHRIFSRVYLERYDRMYNLHPGFLPWGRG